MKTDRKTGLPRVHFVDKYIVNPVHGITIDLVGAGGNGSQMLSALARINAALTSLGKKGLHVRVFDPDKVDAANIGRQLFSPMDIGQNKADCLVSRFNRFYGTGWESFPQKYDDTEKRTSNIVISCVDNVKTRTYIASRFKKAAARKYNPESSTYYWLDLGNGRDFGQAILGSGKIEQPKSKKFRTVGHLPTVDEEFDLSTISEKDSGPSCSLAEALSKQDLFINSSLVQIAGSLLWELFRNPVLDYRGIYLNLSNYKSTPVRI